MFERQALQMPGQGTENDNRQDVIGFKFALDFGENCQFVLECYHGVPTAPAERTKLIIPTRLNVVPPFGKQFLTGKTYKRCLCRMMGRCL